MTERALDATAADFDTRVLARSAEVPVLVDFWAPWCGPCQFLGPILDKVVADLGGAVELVKVNTDVEPELAASYGVSGIPHVALFKEGRVVDQFVGALPEPHLRQWLRPHVPSRGDDAARRGYEKLVAGDRAAARALFQEALRLDGNAAGAHVGLALLALHDGDAAAAESHARATPPQEADQAQAIMAAAKLLVEAQALGTPAALQERVERDATDVEALHALGVYAMAAGRMEDALERLLQAARADKKWNDEAARRSMLVVFNLIGPRHPLSDAYREKLRALYY